LQKLDGVWLGETESVCPVCLSKIKAQKVQYGDDVYLNKTCKEHGPFSVPIWKGLPSYNSWEVKRRATSNIHSITERKRGCPYDCGICPDHRQHTCCVLLEITKNCNLKCPVCFAAAGGTKEKDPSLEEIGQWYDMLKEAGESFNIQISGGEPSLRDDVPEIIQLGKEKGFPFFQLNTNGIRLANDMEYVKRLKDAGLDCVFLQFDSLKDEIFEKLRGKALFEIKKKAMENCAECGLGVVLVPTLVAGLNTNEIGDILNFAIERMPYTRGVHFQPVSYFGRYPEECRLRFTLPELLRAIQDQTEGKMKVKDFKPGTAENPYCSFNGSFILNPDETLKALHKTQSCCCSYSNESEKARQYVAKKWRGTLRKTKITPRNQIPETMDDFIERAGQYTLAVSAMVFQDAWNLDLDRLRDCYIHVVSPDKRIIPFCAYNLTGTDGKALYRR
jgi:7,8-dihydro-6-hydroxymethylpterin dimethyltransferase